MSDLFVLVNLVEDVAKVVFFKAKLTHLLATCSHLVKGFAKRLKANKAYPVKTSQRLLYFAQHKFKEALAIDHLRLSHRIVHQLLDHSVAVLLKEARLDEFLVLFVLHSSAALVPRMVAKTLAFVELAIVLVA